MRKLTIGILITLICAGSLALTACKEKEPQEPVDNHEELTPFVGDWECEDNPLNDPDNYTGYLKLTITQEGRFILSDDEAENPNIEGTIEIISDHELEVRCIDNADFDPPPTWYNMKTQQVFSYQFKSEEKLYITYESDDEAEDEIKSTLIFDKVKK